MVGDKLVFMLQTLGRIPGLGFMDIYASTILEKTLAARSHKERAMELRDRGAEVGKAGKDMGGGGGKGKGGKGKPGPGGRGGGGGGGGGPPGRGTARGGSGGGSVGQNNGWGTTGADRGGLRRSPPSNTDRLRGDGDSGRDPQQDRLRRKNYDL